MKVKNKYLYVILSFVLLSIIGSVLFLHTGHLFGASDFQFNIKRITELKASILHSIVLPTYSFNCFHGSAVMGMYPYIILLPIVIISFIIPSFIYSYYIFFILILFFTLLISFFSSLRYSKSLKISYLFSIIYGMSITFVGDMFIDGDIGIVTSLAFLPLVIFGFLDIINGYTDYFKLTLGITLMVYCQITAIFIVLSFLIVWLFINIKYMNINIITNLLKSSVLTLLLTGIIWIPFLSIILFNRINTVVPVQLNGVSLSSFIKNVGPVAILSILFSLINYTSFNKLNKQMFYLSLLIIFLSSKLMPWHIITSYPILNKLNQLQFTARFLIIPQILLCYLFAYNFLIFLERHKHFKKIGTISLILCIIILQILGQFYVLSSEIGTNPQHISTYHQIRIANPRKYVVMKNSYLKYLIYGYSSNTDYYPRSDNNKISYINNMKSINKSYGVHLHHIGYNTFSFTLNTLNHQRTLKLPFVIYRNEKLHIYLNHHLTTYKNNNGIIEIKNIKKHYNLIKFKYCPNIYSITMILSLFMIGLIWSFIYLQIRKYKI